MMKRLNDLAQKASDDECSVLFVVVMSHGNRGVVMGTDDKPVPVDDILKSFNGRNCPGMAGCPKVFLFQCCRSGKLSFPSHN